MYRNVITVQLLGSRHTVQDVVEVAQKLDEDIFAIQHALDAIQEEKQQERKMALPRALCPTLFDWRFLPEESSVLIEKFLYKDASQTALLNVMSGHFTPDRAKQRLGIFIDNMMDNYGDVMEGLEALLTILIDRRVALGHGDY